MPGGPTNPDDLGRVNYDAVRASHPDGERWPAWQGLAAEVQRAWIAGALAVQEKIAG